MNSFHRIFTILSAILIFFNSTQAQKTSQLKINPLLLSAVAECRNITKSLDDNLFKDWKFNDTPILFYLPNVQEVLLNFPHQPNGFTLYEGFNPLGTETIYYRNDTTFFTIDDQNTTYIIDEIPVLVVADPFSSMRNQLRDVIRRPEEWTNKWLDDWNFIPSPYQQLQLILHESFHVYQNKMAPDKQANEGIVMQYPVLDPVNNSLYVLEGNILRDALLTKEPGVMLEKIKQFVSVRSYRQSRLDSNLVEYENLNEFSEGLAKYIEYKFLQLGETVEPVSNMFFYQGFNGYKGVLSEKFRNVIMDMVSIVAVDDDRFGNKFGTGPLRFKLYDLGACQSLLLDEVMPLWKEKIFNESVFISGLLEEAAALKDSEYKLYLEKAKNEYNYDKIYKSKLIFELEGKEQIQQKLSNILESRDTVIKIFYGDLVDKVRLGGFTPFGVTQVTKRSAIFDLVPIRVLFTEGTTLEMKKVLPVLIDRDEKMIAFSVKRLDQDFVTNPENIETNDFVLKGNFKIVQKENIIEIHLF